MPLTLPQLESLASQLQAISTDNTKKIQQLTTQLQNLNSNAEAKIAALEGNWRRLESISEQLTLMNYNLGRIIKAANQFGFVWSKMMDTQTLAPKPQAPWEEV